MLQLTLKQPKKSLPQGYGLHCIPAHQPEVVQVAGTGLHRCKRSPAVSRHQAPPARLQNPPVPPPLCLPHRRGCSRISPSSSPPPADEPPCPGGRAATTFSLTARLHPRPPAASSRPPGAARRAPTPAGGRAPTVKPRARPASPRARKATGERSPEVRAGPGEGGRTAAAAGRAGGAVT